MVNQLASMALLAAAGMNSAAQALNLESFIDPLLSKWFVSTLPSGFNYKNFFKKFKKLI